MNCEVELPPTEEEAKAMTEAFQNFKPGTGRLMFTIETLEGENVGGANINAIDERSGTFSIGMQIDRDQRGMGFGTAALEILLRYAFFERRLNKYYGSVLEGNIGSATLRKKLGCREEGRRTQRVFTDGRYWDEMLLCMTRKRLKRI